MVLEIKLKVLFRVINFISDRYRKKTFYLGRFNAMRFMCRMRFMCHMAKNIFWISKKMIIFLNIPFLPLKIIRFGSPVCCTRFMQCALKDCVGFRNINNGRSPLISSGSYHISSLRIAINGMIPARTYLLDLIMFTTGKPIYFI